MSNRQTGNGHSNAYRSYLVRFWQSHEQGCWRAAAQCVQTGKTVLFGDVASLLAFLDREIQSQSSADQAGALPLPAGPRWHTDERVMG